MKNQISFLFLLLNEKPDFIGKKMKNHKRENKGTTQRRECQRDPILEKQIEEIITKIITSLESALKGERYPKRKGGRSPPPTSSNCKDHLVQIRRIECPTIFLTKLLHPTKVVSLHFSSLKMRILWQSC